MIKLIQYYSGMEPSARITKRHAIIDGRHYQRITGASAARLHRLMQRALNHGVAMHPQCDILWAKR